jgi:pilus assembly protein CpaF
VARAQIASAISVVVQANRLSDGRRKVTSITEITGMEGDMVSMQEIFTYRQTGVEADGSVKGHFQASGVRPRFADRLKARGLTLPETMFDPYTRWE